MQFQEVNSMLYDRIEPLLAGVSKPARYTGGEVNMIGKDPARMSCI